MMFEGKHIHYSPVNKKPLCSYSAKLCKQRRINGYAFCIRHILEDKSAPFKQCAHVARYNKQKCTNPIPCNENREFCNSHMQVAGMLPKKERKIKKEKEKEITASAEGKLKFSDRLKALLIKENSVSCNEDTFNSDDPYAFPDPVSETGNGLMVYGSATPILKSAWNCSQKSSPEVSSLDSPSRCDSANKNMVSGDNKLKSNAPKLSKTMNRLHAKIAQNILLDKQKKTLDASQGSLSLTNAQLQTLNSIKNDPLSPMEVTSINSESNEPKIMPELTKSDLLIKIDPIEDQVRSEESIVSNCVSSPNPPSILQTDSHLSSGVNSCSSSEKFFGKREKSPTPSDLSSKDRSNFDSIKLGKNELLEYSKIPIVLRKVHRIFKNRKKKNKYIFPSGYDSSESDSTDSETESHLFSQLAWFNAWDRSSSSLHPMKTNSRSEHHFQLKNELMRSYHQLSRLRSLHKQEREHRQAVVQPLIEAARAYPNQTTEIISKHLLKGSAKQKKMSKPVAKKEKTCCYRQDDFACNNIALPYTSHCKKHIMYNVDQLLFEHCTAKFSDNTQCCIPVFDICHELPLCFEHAKKRDNYQKMVSEPKPKKPRKKPKPSALTRPPKRGKKKKKPNVVRPSSPFPIPAPPSLPPLPQPATPVPTITHIEMPNISYNSEIVKTVETVIAVSDMNKDLNNQLPTEITCELEELSPGAIDKNLELPLDAAELANQASKLLEEHDFTEVLNKIPDDAFNDLFVDAKNGDYMPTTEETEELERALAAVSKDVHLAKESLAKLSSSNTGPDLEELERSIEIHGGLLGAENLTSAIDDSSFSDINSSHIDNLNIISSSFSTSDLNSFTQALSAMASDSLDQNHLPHASESTLISNAINLPLVNSDLSHLHMLNGHSELLTGLQHLPMDAPFSPTLLNTSSPLNIASTVPNIANTMPNMANTVPTTGDARLLNNSSLLSAVLYNLGQSTSNAPPIPQTTFSVAPTSVSNITDEATLLANSGGLNSSHWLLNTPDQVLALSQLAYQNGFLVTSQSGTPYTNALVGKYPLLDLNAEVSLGACDSLMAQAGYNADNVICSTNEQPIHSLNIPNGPASSLQQASSVKVIVQEGAS